MFYSLSRAKVNPTQMFLSFQYLIPILQYNELCGRIGFFYWDQSLQNLSSTGNTLISNEKSPMFLNLIKNKNVIFASLVHVDMNNNYATSDVCISSALINKSSYPMIHKRKHFTVCIFKSLWIYHSYPYKLSKSTPFYRYCRSTCYTEERSIL